MAYLFNGSRFEPVSFASGHFFVKRHSAPTDAALILGLEAVFAGIAAWLALRQGLLPLQVLGCGIILAAVMFSQLKSLHPTKT